MTVGKYISNVRAKISDAVVPYRVPDTEITESLTAALQRARQVRPSLCYQDGVLVPDASDVAFAGATSATVRTALDRYAEALVFLAASRVLLNDNADTLNVGLAEKYETKAMGLLGI